MLTIPDALPPAFGAPSRARSNASIDAAPETPASTSISTTSASGGWPGQPSTSPSAAAVENATVLAIAPRCAGIRPASAPSAGAATPNAITAPVRIAAAVARETPWPVDQVRVRPQAGERHERAVEREVHPQPVADRRRAPRSPQRGEDRRVGRRRGAVRAILQPVDGEDREHGGEDAGGRERRRPAEVAERGGEGSRGHQLADRAGDARQRGGERVPVGREPVRRHAQDVEEHAGVAGADQRAAHERQAERRAEGEQQLTRADRRQAHRQRPARAEPVGEQPGGDLHHEIQAELHDREHRDRARGHAEAARRVQRGDAEAHAMEDGDDVERRRQCPHPPWPGIDHVRPSYTTCIQAG